MSALSENNVQNVTNRAFPLRGKEKEKKLPTHSSIMLLYCTNYPSIGLYRDIPSSIISLKLVDKYKNVMGYIASRPKIMMMIMK